MTELEKRERNEPRKPGLPTFDEIQQIVSKIKGKESTEGKWM